ncbi:uncharacterized protein [Scyliorhinus torazame]|uniref:uncharacterized protein n=1 Tax=Scyliorhinus torazame TaxID=75743 RepID=UPI003B598114
MYSEIIIRVLLISAVAIADLKVIQKPKLIEITEGEEFQIFCNFTASTMPNSYGITWYKQLLGRENRTVTNKSEEFIGRILENYDTFSKSKQLTVIDATQNDSGIYYCKVDCVTFRGTGMGTRVTVKSVKDNKTEVSIAKRNLSILPPVLMVTILLLLQVTILIALGSNKCQGRTSRAGNEVQGDTSNTVDAEMRIAKPLKHSRGYHVNEQIVGPTSPADQQDENTIVYATVEKRIEGRGTDENSKQE